MKDNLKKSFDDFKENVVDQTTSFGGRATNTNTENQQCESESINTLSDGSSQKSIDWTMPNGDEYHDSCND